MNEIVKKSWKSTKEEASLRGIWKSVKRVMNRCEKGVRDCADRNWSLILFWLNSCEDNKADIRSFNIDVKSNVHKSYTEYWQRFMSEDRGDITMTREAMRKRKRAMAPGG